MRTLFSAAIETIDNCFNLVSCCLVNLGSLASFATKKK